VRDCKSCVFNSYAHNGCCSWDCNYISRKEAVEAWNTLHSGEPRITIFGSEWVRVSDKGGTPNE